MTTNDTPSHVRVGDLDVWVDQRGEGPDVFLIAGLSDPAEAWDVQFQTLADRFRLTAFDNPGSGRTAFPDGELSVASMADLAADLMATLGIESAHVAGFSGGSVIAQELALRHPEAVRSLTLISTWARSDAYLRSLADFWHWMAESAPSEEAMLEAFFLWIYTARAHADGTVAAIIKDALAFPHPQSTEAFQRQLAAFMPHDTYDRLPELAVPTLVVAGEEDRCTPPRLGQVVAERIPGARFEVLAGEAHQPFQEAPEVLNPLVEGFWREAVA